VCLRWSRDSDGAFDVTVGPLMKAWGFFRDEGRRPDDAQLRAALAVVGYRHVVVDRERHTVRFDRPGVELDLGGIGKGYAADRVAAVLRRRGIASALVNLGGSSVYGLGTPPGAPGWEVGGRRSESTRPQGPERVAARPGAERLGRLRALLREGRRHLLPHHGPADGLSGPGRAERRRGERERDRRRRARQRAVRPGTRAGARVRGKLPPSLGTSVYFFLPADAGGYRLERFGVSEPR
jgi:hypothetical protein